MAWKEIPWADEVATLSDNTPQPVDGTAASAGVSTSASRDDHVHALGKLVADVDCDKHSWKNQVIEQLAEAPADPTQGQIYYNTTDDHLYVYVVT